MVEKSDGDDAMKNLDNLVDKLFNVVREDAQKIEEVVEEAIEPTPKPEADE